MKQLILLPFCLLFLECAANIAQPGIYRAGGGQRFELLFPEDSLAVGKVSMEEELVSVQLYPGFAVVKGEYLMRNLSDSALQFHLGYPVNHVIESSSSHLDMASVWFPEYYALKVLDGGEEQPIALDSSLRYTTVSGYNHLDWYVWDCQFAPGESKTIIVYFLANTNEASVLQGYDKNRDQVFMYLLESGAVWQGPIGTGEIRFQGKNGVSLNASQRMSTTLPVMFHPESSSIVVRFSSLSPDPSHNVIVRGSEWVEAFDFENITSSSDRFFEEIDRYALTEIPTDLTKKVEQQDPFEVTGLSAGWLISLAMMLGVAAPFLIGGVLVALLGYLVLRKIRS